MWLPPCLPAGAPSFRTVAPATQRWLSSPRALSAACLGRSQTPRPKPRIELRAPGSTGRRRALWPTPGPRGSGVGGPPGEYWAADGTVVNQYGPRARSPAAARCSEASSAATQSDLSCSFVLQPTTDGLSARWQGGHGCIGNLSPARVVLVVWASFGVAKMCSSSASVSLAWCCQGSAWGSYKPRPHPWPQGKTTLPRPHRALAGSDQPLLRPYFPPVVGTSWPCARWARPGHGRGFPRRRMAACPLVMPRRWP